MGESMCRSLRVTSHAPFGYVHAYARAHAAYHLHLPQDHVEIQVMSCSSEECVGLDIDVALPHPCNGFEDNEVGFEECVLSNIAELSAMFNEAGEEKEYDAGTDVEHYYAELKKKCVLLLSETYSAVCCSRWNPSAQRATISPPLCFSPSLPRKNCAFSELKETAARMQAIMNSFTAELTTILSAAESDSLLMAPLLVRVPCLLILHPFLAFPVRFFCRTLP